MLTNYYFIINLIDFEKIDAKQKQLWQYEKCCQNISCRRQVKVGVSYNVILKFNKFQSKIC